MRDGDGKDDTESQRLLVSARDALALARLGVSPMSVGKARDAVCDAVRANQILGESVRAISASDPSEEDWADAWANLRSLVREGHAFELVAEQRIHSAVSEQLLSDRRFELAYEALAPSLGAATGPGAAFFKEKAGSAKKTTLATYASGLPPSARMERSAAVALILSTARALLASGETWHSSEVDDALDMLGATAASGAPDIVAESELVQCLRRALPRLGVASEVSPPACAACANSPLKLLACVLDGISAKPHDASIDIEELLSLVTALRVESRAEHLQAQAMVARVALARGHVEALAPIDALVDAGHSDAWELAAHIAAPTEADDSAVDGATNQLVGDASRRRRLLAFALVHSPDAATTSRLASARDALDPFRDIICDSATDDLAWSAPLELARAGTRVGVATSIAAMIREPNAVERAADLLDIGVESAGGAAAWRVLRAGMVAGLWLASSTAVRSDDDVSAWLIYGRGQEADAMAASLQADSGADQAWVALAARASSELSGDGARDWLASACLTAGAAPSTVGELADEDMLHTLARLALWRSSALVPRAMTIARGHGNTAVVAFEAVAAAARAVAADPLSRADDETALSLLTDALADAADATRDPLDALFRSLPPRSNRARSIVAKAMARVAATEEARERSSFFAEHGKRLHESNVDLGVLVTYPAKPALVEAFRVFCHDADTDAAIFGAIRDAAILQKADPSSFASSSALLRSAKCWSRGQVTSVGAAQTVDTNLIDSDAAALRIWLTNAAILPARGKALAAPLQLCGHALTDEDLRDAVDDAEALPPWNDGALAAALVALHARSPGPPNDAPFRAAALRIAGEVRPQVVDPHAAVVRCAPDGPALAAAFGFRIRRD